jgi:zinc protease
MNLILIMEVKMMDNVKEKVLSNGLNVIAVQKKKLPIFQLSLVINAGSVDDPKGKEGLANLTANLIDEGTKKYNAIEIAEKFEELGTNLSISVDDWTTNISIKSLTQNAEKSLELLSDIILNPTFPNEEFEKVKKRTISNIISQKSDPNYVSSILLSQLLYKDHPLSHPTEGYENSLLNITREDVIEFYNSFYVPNNSTLIVVSDLDVNKSIELIEKFFSKWQKKNLNRNPISDIIYPKGKEVYIYHFPGINQAFVFLGSKGISRDNKDFNKFRVVNYILGGSGFSSRIVKTIRVKYGYAYWAYSRIDGGYKRDNKVFEGSFIAGFSTKVESGNHAIELLLDEINKAINEGFKEDELESAKSYYEGSIARQGQTYSQVANIIFNAKLWNLPYDYWIKDIEEIKKLNLNEVNETAKKFLPKDYVILVLADTSQFKFNLKGFDKVEIRDFKLNEN